MADQHNEKKGQMTVSEAGHKGGKEVQHQRDLRDHKEVMDAPYNKPGPAEGEAYGIAAITQALSGLDFPTNKQALLRQAGNQKIHYRKGEDAVSLKEVIQGLETDDFPSMAQVVQAVSHELKRSGIEQPEE